ncbi:MAG: twin-arginine translocase subunit TatC, partial [Planctomycetes bacterium]|nr:twin-arginine translocase subunit TatC [Planctomycetota bacterium]
MSRMSFGDHLEELRRRLILSLAGIAVGAGVALAFSKHIQAILLRPLDVVLQKHGDELKMIALAPPDLFLNWLKIGLISGAILVMPWVLYQMWSFVGAGLYGHERRWVKRFAPISVGLFATGVLFMYFIVLPIVLNFFVGFNRGFTVSNEPPSGLQRMLLGIDPPAEIDDDATTPDLPPIPILQADPADPPPNSMWVNRPKHQLMIQGDKQRWAVPLEDADDRSVVSSNFAIKDYMSFVLSLMLAFGIAFEVPIVVVFLAITGMVPAETMAGARRYVIFAIVVAAMFLTPPDVISQILLAVPMMALFEGGL